MSFDSLVFLILGTVLRLTAINDEERRDTQLVPSHMTKKEPFSLISSYSSDTKLRRRFISGTGDEVIVNDNVLMLLISYENGTYQNLSLSCLPFELYDQAGDLDPSIAMIITCSGDSTVYVLKNNTNGYSVSEHISPPDNKKSSSSAIVIKNGQSTAIYIEPSNFLVYHRLGPDGIRTPFFSTDLVACADWHVSSSSDTKVALHCKTSNKVFLATGSDGSVVDVTSSVNNPDSLKHIRNEHMAIEITSTGATIYQNDFVDIRPIAIPPPMVERVSYAYVDGFLCFLFFSSSSIYLLNTSKPLVDESLEQIVTDEDTLIEYNSSYIFVSPPFNLLSYVVEDKTVKTIDLVTRQYYPSVTQPWIPLLLDMRVQVSAITTSTTTTSTTTTSTSSSETAIVESTAITPTSTDSTLGSVTTVTTQATSTLIPVDGTAVLSVRNIIIITVIVIVFAIVAALVILLLGLTVYYFHSSNSKSAEESDSSDIEIPGTISNHSSYPQLAQQETVERQETDGFIIQQEVDSAKGREEQVAPGPPGFTLTQIYHDQRTPN